MCLVLLGCRQHGGPSTRDDPIFAVAFAHSSDVTKIKPTAFLDIVHTNERDRVEFNIERS